MRSLVSYFGKLPSYQDFVRPADRDFPLEAQQFSDRFMTMYAGMTQYYANSFIDIYDALTPVSFVFPDQNSDAYYVGGSIPSRDGTGNRRAPFLVFARAEPSPLISNSAGYALSHSLFYRVVDRCLMQPSESFDQLSEEATLRWLRESLPKAGALMTGPYRDFLISTPFQELLRESGINRGKSEESVEQFFGALSCLQNVEPANLGAIWRFPLSSNTENSVLELKFWTDLIEKLLGKRLNRVPVLWTRRYVNFVIGLNDTKVLALTWPDSTDADEIWNFSTMKLDGMKPSVQVMDLFRQRQSDSTLSLARSLELLT